METPLVFEMAARSTGSSLADRGTVRPTVWRGVRGFHGIHLTKPPRFSKRAWVIRAISGALGTATNEVDSALAPKL